MSYLSQGKDAHNNLYESSVANLFKRPYGRIKEMRGSKVTSTEGYQV